MRTSLAVAVAWFITCLAAANLGVLDTTVARQVKAEAARLVVLR